MEQFLEMIGAGQQWQLQYKAFDAFMRLSFDMSFVEAFMAAERGTSLTEPASGASSVRKDFSGMAGLPLSSLGMCSGGCMAHKSSSRR